jgi:hypothetical protein
MIDVALAVLVLSVVSLALLVDVVAIFEGMKGWR